MPGSSPRKRGTVPMPSGRRRRRRFIPAQAGNSLARIYRHSRRTVHPRASGEQGPQPPTRAPAAGSSPRKRGTVLKFVLARLATRFIPAQAGNRSLRTRNALPVAVHPRASGEQSFRLLAPVMAPGSSPRKRGTDQPVVDLDQHLRFIPAQAGNRSSWSRRPPRSAVHPRASGEQGRD